MGRFAGRGGGMEVKGERCRQRIESDGDGGMGRFRRGVRERRKERGGGGRFREESVLKRSILSLSACSRKAAP